MLLRSVDRQIGLSERLTAAIKVRRHPPYIDYTLREISWPSDPSSKAAPTPTATTPTR